MSCKKPIKKSEEPVVKVRHRKEKQKQREADDEIKKYRGEKWSIS